MAVTKQTYTLSSGWTQTQLIGIYRSAFIDAGLMTEWYDSFINSSNFPVRVLEVDYDNTKTYGKTYYVFYFDGTQYVGVSICSGWDATNHVPTGTQGLDYHVLPDTMVNIGSWQHWLCTRIEFSMNSSAELNLVRYTSGSDVNQSWFMLYQSGTSRSNPFTILHQNTSLYSWLDLNKGVVNGFTELHTSISSRSGFLSLRMPENIRRALLTGYALNGSVNNSRGDYIFHGCGLWTHTYAGLGNQSDSGGNNYSGLSATSCTFLPIGRSNANPAFTSDYVPICSEVPWSAFTPTPLAADLGIYMHYADNNISLLDTFVVSAGVEEWETLSYVNNTYVNDGASPLFLARVV